jgi:hypothetical protein
MENDIVEVVHNKDGIIILKVGQIVSKHLIAQLPLQPVLPVGTCVNLPNGTVRIEGCNVNCNTHPDEFSAEYFTDCVAFESVGDRPVETVLKELNTEKVFYTLMNTKSKS